MVLNGDWKLHPISVIHQLGAILEAQKLDERVSHSICVAQDNKKTE